MNRCHKDVTNLIFKPLATPKQVEGGVVVFEFQKNGFGTVVSCLLMPFNGDDVVFSASCDFLSQHTLIYLINKLISKYLYRVTTCDKVRKIKKSNSRCHKLSQNVTGNFVTMVSVVTLCHSLTN